MLAILAYYVHTLQIVDLEKQVCVTFCFYKLRKNILFNSTKDCIIEALANPEKERMKHDDTTISSWLQS